MATFDLGVLAGMVVGGVSLVVLVTHLTGGSTTAGLASDEKVQFRTKIGRLTLWFMTPPEAVDRFESRTWDSQV